MKRRLTQDPDDNLIYLTVDNSPDETDRKPRKKKKRVTWKELGAKEFAGESTPAISKDFLCGNPEETPEN